MIQELLGGAGFIGGERRISFGGTILEGTTSPLPLPSTTTTATITTTTASTAATTTTTTTATNSNTSSNSENQNLRCPRCDSSNTKFCYYNNYNLTQPRHFCKTCRRYWTKGGALRNVPIGGGCRKNKNSTMSAIGKSSSGAKMKTVAYEFGRSGFGNEFDHEFSSTPIMWTSPQNSQLLALLRTTQNLNVNSVPFSNSIRVKEEPVVANGALNTGTMVLDPLNQVPSLGLSSPLWKNNQHQAQPYQQNGFLVGHEVQNSGVQELYLTTVLLNPISDKPSQHSPPHDDESESEKSQLESISEEDAGDIVEGPDTSSFTAFLYSLLSSSEPGHNSSLDEQIGSQEEPNDAPSNTVMKENGRRKSLFSRGKSSLKAIYHVARLTGYRSQDGKVDSEMKIDSENDAEFDRLETRHMQHVKEPAALLELPEISEPSLLLTEKTRSSLYASLPGLVQGRKWMLLYSTWRHGISLSTLYRRSMFWPGLSLLVVGDRKGAVFGGLVEAPLKLTNKRKYQGTNSTFVFTNTSGQPVIFRPTGANRYFTLCSTDFLAIGGGGHFALYLDGDLLNGSSSVSETYGNPCLAHSEDFEVKEVELWGFVYASKYEEILSLSTKEMPGICRW